MLKYEEIERLAEFDAQPSPVLSVYLDLDPSTERRLFELGSALGAFLRHPSPVLHAVSSGASDQER